MPDLERCYDEIDAARVRRARELSDIKYRFASSSEPDPSNINSKAVIVLAYANWEGFYNECARAYIRFLQECGGKIRDRDWMMLVGALNADLESLKDRNHSDEARHEFVGNLKTHLECGFDAISSGFIEAKSNLNFARLSWCFSVLSLDLTPLQRFRIKLDKELVQWRHSVAHGDQPDLSTLDINDHIDFASRLLIVLADEFQAAMLLRV
jgi:hypothetical protein